MNDSTRFEYGLWGPPEKVLRMLLTDPCHTCYGDGKECDGIRLGDCTLCGGRGRTPKPELVERIAKELDGWFDDTDTPPVAAAVVVSMLEEQ